MIHIQNLILNAKYSTDDLLSVLFVATKCYPLRKLKSSDLLKRSPF